MVSYSLNEIGAIAKRAARGAGLSWGLAEEAEKSTRWLASFGLPGPRLLSELLTINDCQPSADLAPVSLEGVWEASSALMCPLIAGATLSDCALQLEKQACIKMRNLSYPLLSVAFLADVCHRLGKTACVRWKKVEFATNGKELSIQGAESAISTAHATDVCYCVPAVMLHPIKPTMRVYIDPQVWDTLTQFSHRTYAPATKESRLLGAGAGTTDND